MREGHPTTGWDPKRTHKGQVIHRNTYQRAALQFIGHTHAGNKCEANLELDETFDCFHGCQLEGDIERRVVPGKSLHHFVTRAGLDVMRQERLVAEFFDCY